MPDLLGRLWRVADSWRGDTILALALAVFLLSFDAAAGLLGGARDLLFAACAAGVCGCLVMRRAHPRWAAATAAVLLVVAGAAGSAAGEPLSALLVPVIASDVSTHAA